MHGYTQINHDYRPPIMIVTHLCASIIIVGLLPDV